MSKRALSAVTLALVLLFAAAGRPQVWAGSAVATALPGCPDQLLVRSEGADGGSFPFEEWQSEVHALTQDEPRWTFQKSMGWQLTADYEMSSVGGLCYATIEQTVEYPAGQDPHFAYFRSRPIEGWNGVVGAQCNAEVENSGGVWGTSYCEDVQAGGQVFVWATEDGVEASYYAQQNGVYGGLPAHLYGKVVYSIGFGTSGISGRVTDLDGKPVEGVTIADQLGHATTTDAEGKYKLEGLAPASYVVTPTQNTAEYTSLFEPVYVTVDVPPAKMDQDFTKIGKRLNVPSIKQGSAPWGAHEYDHELSTPYPVNAKRCGTTIGACGCLLTSATMLLQYVGVTRDPSGNATTVDSVNDYLKANPKRLLCSVKVSANPPTYEYYLGYMSDGYLCEGVNLYTIAKYSREAHDAWGTQKIQYQGIYGWNQKTLRQDIDVNMPVILEEPHHFILATGYQKSTFPINDPGGPHYLLDDPKYGNQAYSMRRFKRVNSDFAALVFASSAPTQLLVTDTIGNQTGFDAASGSVVNNIPNAEYGFEPSLTDDTTDSAPPVEGNGTYWLSVPLAPAGSYRLQVIADPGSQYGFGLYAYDHSANLVSSAFSGSASETSPTYDLIYNPDSGQIMLALGVPIDIRPEGNANAINPGAKGNIPVAILTSPIFDATKIDPSSVRFGPARAVAVRELGRTKDVNGDIKPDLLLYFPTNQTGIKPGDTKACLSGVTNDKLNIEGCDAIKTVPR